MALWRLLPIFHGGTFHHYLIFKPQPFPLCTLLTGETHFTDIPYLIRLPKPLTWNIVCICLSWSPQAYVQVYQLLASFIFKNYYAFNVFRPFEEAHHVFIHVYPYPKYSQTMMPKKKPHLPFDFTESWCFLLYIFTVSISLLLVHFLNVPNKICRSSPFFVVIWVGLVMALTLFHPNKCSHLHNNLSFLDVYTVEIIP